MVYDVHMLAKWETLLFFFGVLLLYSVVLVSVVQLSESSVRVRKQQLELNMEQQTGSK